jgi:hypothetical protein
MRMASCIPSGVDSTELNRARWDELARVHGQDGYHDIRALAAGRDSLGTTNPAPTRIRMPRWRRP